jgi:hypothetical protein
MGKISWLGRAVARLSSVVVMGLGMGTLTSCSLVPPGGTPLASEARFLEHRALIDFSGLRRVEPVDSLQLTVAPPIGWKRLPTKKNLLYVHEQWRSPSRNTGVGAAYVRLPLPLSSGAVAWLAKREYGKSAADGKLLAEWTDELGRAWFEAENGKYHVRGYVSTRGREAWIVYCGYRLNGAPDPAEVSLAMRSAETFAPIGAVEAGDASAERNSQDKAPGAVAAASGH